MSIREYRSVDDWYDVPADPDIERDLGYELLELDVFESNGRYVLLPREQDMRYDDEFIVADPESVYDLVDMT